MTRKHRPAARLWFPSCCRFLLALLLAFALTAGVSPVRADDEKPAEKPKTEAPKKEESKAKDAPKKDQPKADDDKKEDAKEEPKEPEKAAPPAPVGNSLPAVKDAAWTKSSPQSLQDLKDIEDRVQAVASRAEKWTVGLIVGQARGSGVIISKEGYVLTAGHVSATPDRPVQIILWNGKVVRGRSLGRNTGIDSGLIKIDEGEDWDHADMGDSAKLKQGDWCIAMGHPGGWQRGRPAVVRLGRIVMSTDRVIGTDATLVGGDSGGPLFDMDGKVIAIHSRIAAPTTANFHVPVDSYRATWDRLASREDWTDRQVNLGAVAAFNAENHPRGARINALTEGGPADQAGLEVGDIHRPLHKNRIRCRLREGPSVPGYQRTGPRPRRIDRIGRARHARRKRQARSRRYRHAVQGRKDRRPVGASGNHPRHEGRRLGGPHRHARQRNREAEYHAGDERMSAPQAQALAGLAT